MSIQIKTIAVTGEKQTEIMNLTTPDLRNGEALIKVHAVALCTLEQRIFRGEVKMPLPCTGGHEVSGEIVALGDGVNKKMWAPGDRVAVRLLYNCGECYYCRTGHANLCERAQKKPVREGLLIGPGGLCDYVIVNTGYLLKIPDTLSYEEASLTEPLACVVHSVTKANIQLGEDVVVIGGGIMGQYHVMLAKRRGARVIMSEVDENRRALARKLGLSDRQTRRAIEEARAEGLIIICECNGRGYYQSRDLDEIHHQYLQDTSRAMAILKRRKPMRDLLKAAGRSV